MQENTASRKDENVKLLNNCKQSTT